MTGRRMPRWSELRPLLHTRPVERDPTERRLARAATVADLRGIARRRTPRAVFDYTDGAAGEELSLLRSRAAFARVEFLPSVLRDVSRVDTKVTILGQRSEMPLVFAPTGFTRMMHNEGELAVARVAEQAGIPYTLSMMGTTSLEALSAATPQARRWFQVSLWRDRVACQDLVARAQATGCEALVLTVDTPVAGQRLRDVHNGLTIPPALTPDDRRRRAAPGLVVQPADHRAVRIRFAAPVGRHGRRACQSHLRSGGNRRRRALVAGGLARAPGREGRADCRGRKGGRRRWCQRRRFLQPRWPSARSGPRPAGTAAGSGGGRGRPCRGVYRRWDHERRGRGRRGGVRRAVLPGGQGIPVRVDGWRPTWRPAGRSHL